MREKRTSPKAKKNEITKNIYIPRVYTKQKGDLRMKKRVEI